MPEAEQRPGELRFEAIGTPWRIDTPEPLAADVVAAVHERIDAFDRVYSRFRDDSLVSRIAKQPGTWAFPPDAAPLLDLYRRLYEATRGSMNPLVGGRLENLGLDRNYSLHPQQTRVSVPRWEDAIAWDGERLTTVRPVVLDVGAAGKGYLVDLVADVLRESGVEEYVVDASGDLVHRGPEPLRVALEHPLDPESAIGVCDLQNAALCASAPNRRAWASVHHIIDAVSGDPTDGVSATWAVASSGLLADGLATALFFESAAALTAAPTPAFEFEYVRMFPSSRVEYSTGFPGELFT